MRHEPHTTSGGAASVVAIRVLALFILAVVAGCRIPDAEFGRMAKPIGAPALYAATKDCGTPVPWPAIDRAHDEYFDAYWKLRAEVAAPMAMACIDAAGQPSLPSIAQLDELAAKQRSLLPALAAIDDRLFDAVQAAVPSCEGQLRDARSRRAVERAKAAFGSGGRALAVDLDAAVTALRLSKSQQDLVRPLMENYRGRFAAAVAVAADAKFNLPKRWLEALESQGVGPDEIFAPPASEGMLAKLSRDDKRRILEAAARASEREMDVELARIRAINDATIAEIAAADAATGELLARSLQGNYVDARRRRMVFVAEAMLQVPAAQAAPIAERFSAYLKVEEAEARANERLERQQVAARAAGTEVPKGGMQDQRMGPRGKPSKEVSDAAARVSAVSKEFPELAEAMQRLNKLTAPDREALAAELGSLMPPAAAERIASLAPAAVIRPERVEASNPDDDGADPLQEPSMPSGTYQFMHPGRFKPSQQALLQRIWLTPEATQAAVQLAIHDAEILESAAWQDLAQPLEQAEKKVDELFLEEKPGVQQAIDQYASLARQTMARLGASDDRLVDALAAIHGAAADDPRTVATRVFLTSRRTGFDWELGPWDLSSFIAPVKCPRFDPVAVAMACSTDAATCTKALALVCAHADDWRAAMGASTDAAFDSIRAMVTQTSSTDGADFVEYVATKPGMATVARLRDRLQPLRTLQADLLRDIGAQCGAEAGRAASLAAARASLPDFYDMTDPAAAGIARIVKAIEVSDPSRAAVDVVNATWIAADGDNAQRLMALLDSREHAELPGMGLGVDERLTIDIPLARLVAERERAAERAARDAWIGLPDAARAPSAPLGGRLRFR